MLFALAMAEWLDTSGCRLHSVMAETNEKENLKKKQMKDTCSLVATQGDPQLILPEVCDGIAQMKPGF